MRSFLVNFVNVAHDRKRNKYNRKRSENYLESKFGSVQPKEKKNADLNLYICKILRSKEIQCFHSNPDKNYRFITYSMSFIPIRSIEKKKMGNRSHEWSTKFSSKTQ